jgi:hypothetical protein
VPKKPPAKPDTPTVEPPAHLFAPTLPDGDMVCTRCGIPEPAEGDQPGPCIEGM